MGDIHCLGGGDSVSPIPLDLCVLLCLPHTTFLIGGAPSLEAASV